MRLVVGNLDCESDYVGKHQRLPPKVEARICAAATLLSVLAREGDRVWTRTAVSPDRILGNGLLPTTDLVSGRLALGGANALLAWGETTETAAIRGALPSTPPLAAEAFLDRVWATPTVSANVAKRVNDKTFAHGIAKAEGLALPWSCVVRTVAELADQVARASADRWVLKGRHGAAGRARLLGQGATLTAPAQARARRLLAVQGSAVFEPWMDRTDDLGCTAFCTARGPQALALHSLIVDGSGGFCGVETGTSLDDNEQSAINSTVGQVNAALIDAGYRGPFGVDMFRYRDAHGEVRLHPLVEINARLTFGFVARALAERAGSQVKLRFGDSQRFATRPSTATPLFSPGGIDRTGAWIEPT